MKTYKSKNEIFWIKIKNNNLFGSLKNEHAQYHVNFMLCEAIIMLYYNM